MHVLGSQQRQHGSKPSNWETITLGQDQKSKPHTSFSEAEATQKGHMLQTRKGVISTR